MIIDGREVDARGTLLETVLALGIDLPHLCKDDNLPPIGACRTCLVEADGRIVAACHTPADGIQEVRTTSERVLEIRRAILRLTAGMHGPVQDRAGGPRSSEIWAAYESHGIDWPSHPWRVRTGLDTSSPFFVFDEQPCILCGRCVAACQQLQHIGAIGIAWTATAAQVTAGTGVPFAASACTACGSCVAACPTYALRPKLSTGTPAGGRRPDGT
ncbi:2Fe-2S iron-sulfur cluster-binding protein [Tepidiforma sp.]|uniref:2Fe-2S iron-sulfur cluster-binding protein n=1 Tax=Tepidiforma sp. TaxID=2682230 RepID=UPI0034DE341A